MQREATGSSKTRRMKTVIDSLSGGDLRIIGCTVVLLAAAGTSGCEFGGYATAETTGIVVGGTAAAATGDPVIGLAAGMLSSWAVKAGLQHYQVSQQAGVQDSIAQAGGDAALEQASSWEYDELHGAVEVTRVFGKSIPCKELVYTVNHKQQFVYHVGTICQSGDRWEWAVPQARAKQWIEQPDPLPSEAHEPQPPFEAE